MKRPLRNVATACPMILKAQDCGSECMGCGLRLCRSDRPIALAPVAQEAAALLADRDHVEWCCTRTWAVRRRRRIARWFRPARDCGGPEARLQTRSGVRGALVVRRSCGLTLILVSAKVDLMGSLGARTHARLLPSGMRIGLCWFLLAPTWRGQSTWPCRRWRSLYRRDRGS